MTDGADHDAGSAQDADDDDLGTAPGDRGLSEGIEHLQRAAREMIAASRAVLDVVERLVDDPDSVGRIGSAIGSAAARARHGGFESDGTEDGPVERIRVD